MESACLILIEWFPLCPGVLFREINRSELARHVSETVSKQYTHDEPAQPLALSPFAHFLADRRGYVQVNSRAEGDAPLTVVGTCGDVAGLGSQR